MTLRTRNRIMPLQLPAATRVQLVEMARAASRDAYCPYSKFRVGAAVMADGQFFTGCNVENASYGLTICAERSAIFAAVSVGCRSLQAIAVSCPDAANDSPAEYRMPCGACRQVIAEFASPNLLAIIDKVGDYPLMDLLPRPFSLIQSKADLPQDRFVPRKMRLCLDIDNVLARSDEAMRRVIREVTGGRVKFEYHHICNFNYYECADARGEKLDKKQWPEVHDRFSEPDLIREIEPYPDIQAQLTRLADSFELHLATARLPKAREATTFWLKRHDFPRHSLHFLNHGEKHQSLGRFFASVEDDRNQAEAFAHAGVHSFLLAHPWNETANESLLHRYSSWNELAPAILQLAGAN